MLGISHGGPPPEVATRHHVPGDQSVRAVIAPRDVPDVAPSDVAVAAEESDSDPGVWASAVRGLPMGRPLRLAYYFPQDSASFDSLRANIRHLDVVAPHWLTIDATGSVESIEGPQAVAFLHGSSALVLPSVALTSKRAGHAIVTDAEVQSEALGELVAAAEPWDGLALDFEGLDPDDRGALSDFINQLGTSLHEQRKLFAIALPAKTRDTTTGWAGAYDYAAIASSADLFLVMAYGFRTGSSGTPGSTAPLPWVDASMAYAASVIDPNRLILGVPFYGYDWNVTRGPPARALRYRDVRDLLDRTGAVPYIDPESASATFEYFDGEQQHEVWYEDERSLAAKLNLVRKYALRGVGAWRLGQEDPKAWVVWDQVMAVPFVNAQLP